MDCLTSWGYTHSHIFCIFPHNNSSTYLSQCVSQGSPKKQDLLYTYKVGFIGQPMLETQAEFSYFNLDPEFLLLQETSGFALKAFN